MVGIALDQATDDLGKDANGDLLVVNDNDRFGKIKMIVQSSLRTFSGEVFTDGGLGCEWIRLFQIRAPRSRLAKIIGDEVRTHAFDAAMPNDQTNDIELTSIDFDGITRQVHMTLRYDGREIRV